MPDKLRKLLVPLAITLAVALLSTWGYFQQPAFLEHLELQAFDERLRLRGPRAPFGHVVVVAVDEQSLERIGRWPWSRDVMARLVKAVDAASPRAVGYDIGFFDPQAKPGVDELVRLVGNAKALGIRPTPELKAYFQQRLRAADPDLLLAEALAGAKTPQVLGYYFRLADDDASGAGSPMPVEPPGDPQAMPATATRYLVRQQLDDAPGGPAPVPRAVYARTNIQALADAAGRQAYFNVVPDPDGVVRRYPMGVAFGGTVYQPLAGALFSAAVPEGLPTLLATRQGLVGVQWQQHRTPTDASGRMLLNYRGPGRTITHVPAWKLLEPGPPPPELADAYVLVGVTAPAVFDMRITPLDVAYPGVEIHATALDTMLAQDFIVRPSWAPLSDLAAIWCLCMVCLALLWRIRPALFLIGFLALAGGYAWVNVYIFEVRQFWLSMIHPLAGFTLSFMAVSVYRFMFADRQGKRIRSAFGKYLDPAVVEQVVADPEKLALGGEELDLTVLFSDIRGFTGISERVPPADLVPLLNEYFTAMTDVVLSRKGLLDKYIGDAVMAVFGAPYPYDNHAEAACHAALDMVAALEAFNAGLAQRGQEPFDMGVGLNTGTMVAGNMGSTQRLSYTVMGEGVNVASRLEGLNKVYGTRILISRSTQDRIGAAFWTRTVDIVRPVGAREPVEIFELLAPMGHDKPLDYMGPYLKMVELYRAGEFDAAREMVDNLAAEHPEDGVLAVYRERLPGLCAAPPRQWDGVYECQSK